MIRALLCSIGIVFIASAAQTENRVEPFEKIQCEGDIIYHFAFNGKKLERTKGEFDSSNVSEVVIETVRNEPVLKVYPFNGIDKRTIKGAHPNEFQVDFKSDQKSWFTARLLYGKSNLAQTLSCRLY